MGCPYYHSVMNEKVSHSLCEEQPGKLSKLASSKANDRK